MSLSELEQHVFAYYVAGHANELNIATRWYPYGELTLVIADKVTVAVRKFGRKPRASAKAVATAFLDHMIEKGAWATKQNEFGGQMHQFQADKYKAELKALQKRTGITFVFVTHDQEEALTMSDRIAEMNDGRVLQVDTPYELYEDPESRFVANFIGETNFLTGKTDRVAGSLVYVRLDNGAMTTIETGNGAIGETVKAGAAVTVAIRPEKIYLGRGDAPAEADNAYAGKVENIVYIGTDTYYDMDLPGQTKVTVRQQNQDYTGSANTLAVGDMGYVAWRAHNASLLME